MKNTFSYAASAAALTLLAACGPQAPAPVIDVSNAPAGPYNLIVDPGTKYTTTVPDMSSLKACFDHVLTMSKLTNNYYYGACINKENPRYGVKFYCNANSDSQKCMVKSLTNN
jgi:hypothetical protein